MTIFESAIALTAKINASRTIEVIGMERKLGQAYYSLGEVKKADEHFRQALDIMGIIIPAEGQKIKNVEKLKISQLSYTNDKVLEPGNSRSELFIIASF